MTADRRAQAVADTTSALDWFTIPHTLERVIGIYAEATREHQRPMRPGLSNEEILSRLTSRTDAGPGSRGGHSDPTARDALAGMQHARDDADETLRSIDCALELIVETCVEINSLVGDGWAPTWPHSRDSRVVVARKLIGRFAPLVEPAVAAGADEGHLTFLLATSLAETAEWLQRKCEAIWQASRGDRRPVAVQKKISECRICGGWRKGTIAVQAGRCQECHVFHGNHQCERTEAIVRRADYGKGPTPAQMVEARAGGKQRKRAAV